jgi:HlyD family secretion protein
MEPVPTTAAGHPPDTERRGCWTLAPVVAAGLLAAVIGLAAPSPASPQAEARAAAAEPSAATLAVEVVSPRRVNMPRSLAASGSLAARDELVVGSDAAGVRLVEVLADTGTTVRLGQLLARGDSALLQAQRLQLEAQVRQARAELAQARANLERAERVEDAGVYSVEFVQTRRTAAESAQARLELALAQQAEVDVRIAQTRVVAPADGVISRRTATVGSVTQPGAELFRLIRDHEVEWRAEVPDHAIAQLKPGMAARLRVEDGREVEGRVRLIAPTVDARTRNGLVHVSLPRDAGLKPGAHAQGEFVTGQAEILTLPEAVLLSRDGQAYVYVIGADGKAHATRVDVGSRRAGRVEVRGLAPDARVIATGAGFVKDGEAVGIAAHVKEIRS